MKVTVMANGAGSGKTTAAAERVAKSERTPIEIYAPTIEMALHWQNQILSFNPSKRISVIRGRNQLDLSATPLCLKADTANKLTAAGLPVYNSLCKQGQGTGAPPLKCPHYDGCGYNRQFGHADVYIYTHAHLGLERGPLEKWEPSFVIIDESFFQSCIANTKFSLALLTHPALPTGAQDLCRDLLDVLQQRRSVASVLRPAFLNGTWDNVAGSLSASSALLTPRLTTSEFEAAIRESVNFTPIATMMELLALGANTNTIPQSIVCDNLTGYVSTFTRKKIKRFTQADGTQPVGLILDASASHLIISQFFEIQDFIKNELPRRAHVVQCTSTRGSTTSLVPERNTDPKSKITAQEHLNELQEFIEKFSAGSSGLLVVGPTAIVGNPKTGLAPLLSVPSNCVLAHFQALRGVDKWKGFDSVVVIGRYQPPVQAVEDIARSLFQNRPQPMILNGELVTEPRGYRTTGEALGVDVMVHPEPCVQEVLEQLRENESLQAIDRLRLIYNDEIKTVVVLSSIPLDLEVHQFRTWDELMHGTRLEQVWSTLNGVLPLTPAWLSERYPHLWSTPEAAKQDVLQARKKGGLSNSISIRKITLFNHEYKAANQRRWSNCIAHSTDISAVKSEIEQLTGTTVTVRLLGPAE